MSKSGPVSILTMHTGLFWKGDTGWTWRNHFGRKKNFHSTGEKMEPTDDVQPWQNRFAVWTNEIQCRFPRLRAEIAKCVRARCRSHIYRLLTRGSAFRWPVDVAHEVLQIINAAVPPDERRTWDYFVSQASSELDDPARSCKHTWIPGDRGVLRFFHRLEVATTGADQVTIVSTVVPPELTDGKTRSSAISSRVLSASALTTAALRGLVRLANLQRRAILAAAADVAPPLYYLAEEAFIAFLRRLAPAAAQRMLATVMNLVDFDLIELRLISAERLIGHKWLHADSGTVGVYGNEFLLEWPLKTANISWLRRSFSAHDVLTVEQRKELSNLDHCCVHELTNESALDRLDSLKKII